MTETTAVREITKVSEGKFNELPTQIAYHLGNQETVMTEVVQTGGTTQSGQESILTRMDGIDTGLDQNTQDITGLLQTVSDLSVLANDNKTSVGTVSLSLANSPTAGESLVQWAASTQTTLDNATTGLTDVEDSLGEQGATSGTAWDNIRSNALATQSVTNTVSANNTAIADLSVLANDNKTSIGNIALSLANSPTAGESLVQWAASTQAALDATATDITAIQSSLDDLTIAW